MGKDGVASRRRFGFECAVRISWRDRSDFNSHMPLSYNWGIVQNQRMKLKPSLRAFQAFCRLFPDNERGWYMMAQVARNMDDVEVLVSASRRLFQLNPNHGEGYGQLGDALSDLKYYLPAISTLRKALEIRRLEPVPFPARNPPASFTLTLALTGF